jgi:predicted alpha/beta hydrolase family esterase
MTSERKQICIIHGGDAFASDADARHYLETMELNYERLLAFKGWKNWLAEQLPDYDVLLPQMPSKFNAKYDEWALYFSKVVPFLRPDAVLIGHSMGGIFLAKYFTENPPAEPFAKLILVAAPYDDESRESLRDFKIIDASALANAAKEIHLFFSTDDPSVPFVEKDKYLRDLPAAIVHAFNDKQHFNMPEFPELIEILLP